MNPFARINLSYVALRRGISSHPSREKGEENVQM